MSVYVNRVLNLKKIKAIGFDMDHTIVKYHTEAFEEFTYKTLVNKLIEKKDYPEELRKLNFNPDLTIQGLVIDKRQGHTLKLSRYGKVKLCFHGTKPLDFKEQQKTYADKAIALPDSDFQSLDTSFAIAHGVLYTQLVDLKVAGIKLPTYEAMTSDIKNALDEAHRDDSLKKEVRNNLKKYIVQDSKIPQMLEFFKKFGKRLLVVTNSDYYYTKLLLDYTINPYLKNHKHWQELFEVIITYSSKPSFFTERRRFLKIDPKNGMMSNYDEKIIPGIYQGGNAEQLQSDLGLEGQEILYLGDHIFGDVVSLKKHSNWRTALVLEPLEKEVQAFKKNLKIQEKIDLLMGKKQELEHKLDRGLEDRYLNKKKKSTKSSKLFSQMEKINSDIYKEITKYNKAFNSYWGELMRAGQEESLLAGQVERFACIYMASVTNLMDFGPFHYFRPHKRVLPHELT